MSEKQYKYRVVIYRGPRFQIVSPHVWLFRRLGFIERREVGPWEKFLDRSR